MSQLKDKCAETVKAKEEEKELLEEFWAINSYVDGAAGSYDYAEDFKNLVKQMAEKEKDCANRLFLPCSASKHVQTHHQHDQGT